MTRWILLALFVLFSGFTTSAFAQYPICGSGTPVGYCMSPGGKLYSCGGGTFVSGNCTNSMTCSDVCAQCQGGDGGCMTPNGTIIRDAAEAEKLPVEKKK